MTIAITLQEKPILKNNEEAIKKIYRKMSTFFQCFDKNHVVPSTRLLQNSTVVARESCSQH